MTALRRVKARSPSPQLVAVISSPADLQQATRLRHAPDFFELRLDALCPLLPEAQRFIAKLAAPLIITARHPAEAGMHNLSPARRCELLLRYLPQADYVDIELRSLAEMRPLLHATKHHATPRIISVHDFRRTPPPEELRKMLDAARAAHADVFKIVTRTDTDEDAAHLLEFFEQNKRRLAISAMATGKLGREMRLTLARRGSVLNYVHLGTRQVEGQLSLAEMCRALKLRS